MEQSDNINELAAALAKAQGVFVSVAADKTSQIGTRIYTYANLASVLDAIRKPLAENGLSITQGIDFNDKVTEQSSAVIITTQLMHSSGQWIRSSLPMPIAMNAKPQDIGSATTYGRRYGVSAIVGIAAEDDDGKAASDENPPTRQNARPQPPKPTLTRPPAPKDVEPQETPPAIDPTFERYNRMKEAGLKRWPESPGQAIPAAIGRWLQLNKFGIWTELTPEKQEEAIAKMQEEAELA